MARVSLYSNKSGLANSAYIARFTLYSNGSGLASGAYIQIHTIDK
jgi:hypothetical protein